ncbi:MAG: tRNA 2-thiouridine(34) synthase MnmA [Phycisphaerales bacterium]|nr:tRNA 2-thiouridine(34) synthase MnmA [Phycisphaerales bacterium]
MPGRKGKVLVAMSGGVDSSVAAAILLREGYEVVGCFMRLGSPGETLDELTPADEACRAGPGPQARAIKIGHQGCCSITDAADARAVAAELGIPFYVCNFKKDFGRIIDYFVDEYTAGRTPNPCVRCNDWLKFGKLHDYARQIGADFIASGHYARVAVDADGSPALLRGIDHAKDQSYVLFGAPRERLREMLLPIGGLHKPQVRDLAKQYGLPVFDKPDSQEICFVPDNDYAGLVDRRRPDAAREGPLLDAAGRRIGTHDGQHRFTIGQRRGVDISLGYRVYVVDKDPATNTVTVGPRELLAADSCTAGEANWLADPPPVGEWTPVFAKFRYNSTPVPGRVRRLDDDPAPTPSGRVGLFQVQFDSHQQAVAPGQALVLYDLNAPERVLGGGWIRSVVRIPQQPTVYPHSQAPDDAPTRGVC